MSTQNIVLKYTLQIDYTFAPSGRQLISKNL